MRNLTAKLHLGGVFRSLERDLGLYFRIMGVWDWHRFDWAGLGSGMRNLVSQELSEESVEICTITAHVTCTKHHILLLYCTVRPSSTQNTSSAQDDELWHRLKV
jgi:hypothetical protein